MWKIVRLLGCNNVFVLIPTPRSPFEHNDSADKNSGDPFEDGQDAVDGLFDADLLTTDLGTKILAYSVGRASSALDGLRTEPSTHIGVVNQSPAEALPAPGGSLMRRHLDWMRQNGQWSI